MTFFEFLINQCESEPLALPLALAALATSLITALVLVWQVSLMKRSNSLMVRNQVRKEESTIRSTLPEALKEFKLLEIEYNTLRTERMKVYPSDPDKYKVTRDEFYLMYINKRNFMDNRNLYEYLGVLVENKIISFDIVYESLFFPDDLWKTIANSPMLGQIRNEKETNISDWCINFEKLYKKFYNERKIRERTGADWMLCLLRVKARNWASRFFKEQGRKNEGSSGGTETEAQ